MCMRRALCWITSPDYYLVGNGNGGGFGHVDNNNNNNNNNNSRRHYHTHISTSASTQRKREKEYQHTPPTKSYTILYHINWITTCQHSKHLSARAYQCKDEREREKGRESVRDGDEEGECPLTSRCTMGTDPVMPVAAIHRGTRGLAMRACGCKCVCGSDRVRTNIIDIVVAEHKQM